MIQRKKLGEIANISAGQGAPQGAENYSEEGTPFVKAGDLFDLVNGKCECDIQKVSEEVAKNHKLKLYPKGTVLFAKSGMSCMKGYVYATNAECYVVSHLACIMPFDVDSKYLQYYFEYHKPNRLVKDASYPSISLADIGEMPINVFDDQTQAKIVDNLDAVNGLIVKSKEELGLLDDIVKSRFVEMFGDPVSNERGWNVETLNDVCTEIGDGLHGTPEYDDNGEYPFINGNNLINGAIEITPATKKINAEIYKKHYIDISANALLLSINGTLGKLAFYNGEKVMLGKSACYCNFKPEINRAFVYGVMKTEAFAGFLEKSATASTIKNVGLKAIRGYKLIMPPQALQMQFIEFSNQVDKSKLAVKQSLEKLETLKKSLMQQYFG